jgi:hypothetical protein
MKPDRLPASQDGRMTILSLVDKWKNYRESRFKKKIESNLRLVKNPKATKEDRHSAIVYFASLDDVDIAVPNLLQRFEYSLEHGINDTREKEAALEGILKFGEQALDHLTSHLKKTLRIAWPIKALKKIGTEAQIVETLKASLNFSDIAFDQARIDKNYDILCYLVDYQIGDFSDKIVQFLDVHDERLRFAATELLIEQDYAKIPNFLERFLNDTSAENTRIRQDVVQAFLKNRWPVRSQELPPGKDLGNGIYISKNNVLESRT